MRCLPSPPGCGEGTQDQGSLSLVPQGFCSAFGGREGWPGQPSAGGCVQWRAFWCHLGWASFNNRKWEAPRLIRLLGTKTRCLAGRKEGSWAWGRGRDCSCCPELPSSAQEDMARGCGAASVSVLPPQRGRGMEEAPDSPGLSLACGCLYPSRRSLCIWGGGQDV